MAPKAPSTKAAKYYNSIHICTVLWKENDFKTAPDQNVQTETDNFKTWCKDNLDAKPGRIILPSLQGPKAEEHLLEKLQKFYDTVTKGADDPALTIIVYSGHGISGPVDPGKVPGANYTPRGDASLGPKVTKSKASLVGTTSSAKGASADKGPDDSLNEQVKDREFQRILWYDANPPAAEIKAGDPTKYTKPGAMIDWGWVQSQLKIPAKMDHWIIYNCCHSGWAVLPSIWMTGNKVSGMSVKSAVVHSFVAVGPQIKAKTGPASFLKMVQKTMEVENKASSTGFSVAQVFRKLSAQPEFGTMLRFGEKFAKLKDLDKKTDDELVEWLVEPMDDVDTKALEEELKNWRQPFYATDPPGLIDETRLAPKSVAGASATSVKTSKLQAQGFMAAAPVADEQETVASEDESGDEGQDSENPDEEGEELRSSEEEDPDAEEEGPDEGSVEGKEGSEDGEEDEVEEEGGEVEDDEFEVENDHPDQVNPGVDDEDEAQ